MTYYKVVVDRTIVGVGDTQQLRMVQAKHHILVSCNETEAQYIQIDDTLYHDTWFAPVDTSGRFPFAFADISTISKEEYDELKEEIDEGNTPYVPDEPEDEEPDEPDDEEEEPSAKTRLQQLEEQVELLQETNDMLVECLLEMSEIVYG